MKRGSAPATRMITCYSTAQDPWKHISTLPESVCAPNTTPDNIAPESSYVPALVSDVPGPSCEKRSHSAESLQQVVDQTQGILNQLRKGEPRLTAVLSNMVRDEIPDMAPHILDKLWSEAGASLYEGVTCQGSMELTPVNVKVPRSATFSFTYRNKSQVSFPRRFLSFSSGSGCSYLDRTTCQLHW